MRMRTPDEWLSSYAVYCQYHPLTHGVDEQRRRKRFSDLCRKRGLPTYLEQKMAARASYAETYTTDVPALAVDKAIGDGASDEEYERYFALLEAADELHGVIAPTKDTTTFTATDGLPVGIVFTGDWHCGAGGVLYKQLKADLETIRDTDGLYAITMGDYCENVAPQSKAGTALYSGLFNEPGLQQRYAVMRARIAAGKIIAVAQGNHDSWSYKWAGITRTDELAAQVGAAYFGEGGGTVFADVGSERYVIAVRHNTAGNSRLNTENPMRRMYDEFPQWDNCHVICVAHLHYNDAHVVTRKGGRCIYLRSGTYKVRDAYAEGKGFKSEYGCPLVILLPDTHKVIPFRGDDLTHGLDYLAWLREAYRKRGGNQQ